MDINGLYTTVNVSGAFTQEARPSAAACVDASRKQFSIKVPRKGGERNRINSPPHGSLGFTPHHRGIKQKGRGERNTDEPDAPRTALVEKRALKRPELEMHHPNELSPAERGGRGGACSALLRWPPENIFSSPIPDKRNCPHD